MKCVTCGKEFEKTTYNRKYCSTQCLLIKRYERTRKQYKKISIPKRKCVYCGMMFKPTRPTNKFCSPKCQQKESRIRNLYNSVERFKIRRQNMKRKAVKYKGGKCEKCGYDKHLCALDFHHLDKSKKEGDITKMIRNNNWDKLKPELDKCILLCSNCHRELHFKIYEK